jgi:hypothetical protein
VRQVALKNSGGFVEQIPEIEIARIDCH